MSRLWDKYRHEIRARLAEELEEDNVHALPQLEKVVISMGVGKALQDKKRLQAALGDLAAITGQKAVICKAKKSVSNFKLRTGYEIGAKVTLRRSRMYEFLDRLVNVTVPRFRDFRGLNPHGFDGRGNYSMGIADQSVFPEVDLDKVQFSQGMNITFVTTAKNDSDGRALLQLLGMPFRKTAAAEQN